MVRPTLLAALALSLAFSLPSRAEESVPPEVAAFIPAGFQAQRYLVNDFNHDDRLDALLMLQGSSDARPVLLLLRSDDDKLALATRNDRAILPKGWFSDPFQGISVGSGWFSLAHRVENCLFKQRFHWSRAQQTWLLDEITLTSYGKIRNVEHIIGITTQKGNSLSPVTFADFSAREHTLN
ncbi:hypothetical protein ACFPAG_03595 [Vogesella sp. GCM10023246]|uniref:Uncharacterized protein n=1 Tax=Vogesella oryzagri TaxID=3160864 RepID=A0ABV1M2W9_9NEIS